MARKKEEENSKPPAEEEEDKTKVARMAMASKSKQKKKKKKHHSPSNYWVLVSVSVAILGVILLWFQDTDSLEQFLLHFVCDADGGFCLDGLAPHKRTQQTIKHISPGTRVLVVPRSLQIWDLDALRDDFVQAELLTALHAGTGNPLDSAAFLSAYLARRAYYLQRRNDPMRAYFAILPTYKTLKKIHPALWTDSRLSALLEPHSNSFAIAKAYQDMLTSEYAAFAKVSAKFASQVSEEEYKTMRANVLMRSFGTGPLGPEEALSGSQPIETELGHYQSLAGVDLSKGCYAMVPMLDMYDHHPHPNVAWEYSRDERAFVITSTMPMAPGQDIIDSYGKYTDPHLYAKFGFVNGDGSGYTQASIAALHKPLDAELNQQFSYVSFDGTANEMVRKQQRLYMSRYLHFDDGYDECIEKAKHPEAYELKRLKLEHLLRIANIPEQWIVRVEPRNPTSLPGRSSDVPITKEPPKFDMDKLRLDASKIIATCRLIALSNDDYEGNASEVLKETLEEDDKPIFVKRQTEDLEFRAMTCMSRLAGLNRFRFKEDEKAVADQIRELTKESFQSRWFGSAHVRLAEMQTLVAVQKLGISGILEMTSRIKEREETDSDDVLPPSRDKPCPAEYTNPLVDDDY